MPRYFTKSLHKKALECPTKLFYSAQPDIYDNKKIDDPFLKALAKGGFQVGELAKIYYPGGFEVFSLNHEEALAETRSLLERENVIIYEPAFAFDNFYVRVDILIKQGKTIRLLEVKAKSFESGDEGFYYKALKKKGHYKILEKWKSYLYDIAFQTMVCQRSYPQFSFQPCMVFADKSRIATVNGLNQRFLISEVNKRIKVKVAADTNLKNVGQKILCTIEVTDEVQRILTGRDQGEKSRAELEMPSFYEEAQSWAKAHIEGRKLDSPLSKDCRNCEFRTHGEKKSGFEECWQAHLKQQSTDGELIVDLWSFRKTDQLIGEGRLQLRDVTREDIKVEEALGPGMSAGQRQWRQVEKVVNKDEKPDIDFDFLRQAVSSWVFPLHCIDFETSMVAIPFHSGRRPYEQIAFQFSHHVITELGEVRHQGEFLYRTRGGFPNFDFVRALKLQLEEDQGSIFRYSPHENTVLIQIYSQLADSTESDRDELMSFIRSITYSNREEIWRGPRQMIDLWELVKKGYYHPMTKGSNSLKAVLPAILNDSNFLQNKYSLPIYGSESGILSSNFNQHIWLKKASNGKLIDPYKQLPPIFEGLDSVAVDGFLTDGEELAEGGAAMMAFAKMQFTEMSQLELDSLCRALLRYCELDTLAMVMLIEHFMELTGKVHAQRVG